jgi:uncharacterized membrane protein
MVSIFNLSHKTIKILSAKPVKRQRGPKIMQQPAVQRRTLAERIFHAVSFEVIATAICAPASAWIMQRPVLEMGGLTLLLATAAMIWNVIYNALFDRLWPVHRLARTAKVRACHALGFEGGLS